MRKIPWDTRYPINDDPSIMESYHFDCEPIDNWFVMERTSAGWRLYWKGWETEFRSKEECENKVRSILQQYKESLIRETVERIRLLEIM